MAKRDFPRRSRPKTYTDDFKRDAVRLVTDQKYAIGRFTTRDAVDQSVECTVD